MKESEQGFFLLFFFIMLFCDGSFIIISQTFMSETSMLTVIFCISRFAIFLIKNYNDIEFLEDFESKNYGKTFRGFKFTMDIFLALYMYTDNFFPFKI